MKVGISTGYNENYWQGWPWVKQMGGSEHLVTELASELAKEHEVTVRLPYPADERVWRGVRWIGSDHGSERYDGLYLFDDFAQRDSGDAEVLVACRSDPPPSTDFDQLVFLSQHHARLMGHPGRPSVGGGVNLAHYHRQKLRIPRRVICCSSPDRCPKAAVIGRGFDFVHSYKPVPGFNTVELDRESLIDLQQRAQAMVYPLDPTRPSDFFSMAVLETLAAGTPVIVSDADSMVELWGDAAVVLPRPIRLGQWHEAVTELLTDHDLWYRWSARATETAAAYDWPIVAQKYLDIALA